MHAGLLDYKKKFIDAAKYEMKRHGVEGEKLGVDFIDINMLQAFEEEGITWVDGMTPMMEARAVKNQDEHECMRIVGAIGDAAHWETMKFLEPGITENQVTAHIMQFLYSPCPAVLYATAGTHPRQARRYESPVDHLGVGAVNAFGRCSLVF